MATYLALGGGWPLAFELEGKPWAKMRPRKGKGGRMFQAEEDRDAEKLTKARLRELAVEPLQGNLCLVVTLYMPDRRVRDFDNMVKHLCDAGNGILWRDDSQVTGSAQIIELDRARPRTVVLLGSHESTLLRV